MYTSGVYMNFTCGIINLILLLMQDYKKDAFREAYLQCSNAIQSMERELRTACNAPDAKVDNVLKVSLISRSSSFGFQVKCC